MKQTTLITQTLSAILLLAGSLAAQEAPKPLALPSLQAELKRLGAAAEARLHSLPNFTCDETATSQTFRNQKLHSSIHVQGTVRVVHNPDGNFDETYTYKRPFHLLIIPTRLPFYVSGGFDSALVYFLPSAQPCYQFSLSSNRIDFATRTGPVPGYICKEQGLKGYALLNPAGEVTHIQRSIPDSIAKPLKIAAYAAIDIGSVTLNDHTYRLSQHVVATQPLEDATGRFEATYSNCKLFTSTVTIGPATEIPPTDAAKPQ